MKKIELLSLTLKNFKGIKSLSVNFNSVTSIFGENATGKTTIADAFYWLLFDKDSSDRKQFEIKTLDGNNEPLHHLEHAVTAVLNINGKAKTLQKVYKEKWVTKRGEAEKVFNGHETLYYINSVPVQAKEYAAEISNIVDEKMFKLITNPLCFSQLLKWQERRDILMGMNGTITSDLIIDQDESLEALRALLADNDIDNLKKQVAAKRKRLIADREAIPVRIDECNNSIVEYDFFEMTRELAEKKERIANIDVQLVSFTETDSRTLEMQKKLSSIRNEIFKIEREASEKQNKFLYDAKSKLQDKEHKLNAAEKEVESLRLSYSRLNAEKLDLEIQADNLRKDWNIEYAKELTFDDHQFICPTCNRLYEQDNIEDKKKYMLEGFNKEKARILESISKRGKAASARVKELDNSLIDIQNKSIEIEDNIVALRSEIESDKKELSEYSDMPDITYPAGYYQLKEEAANIEESLNNVNGDEINRRNELVSEKKYLQIDVDNLTKKLQAEESNKTLRSRIDELMASEKKIASQIAELEGQEFLCEKFIKTKVNLLESEINSHFNYVAFKLFDIQINGGLVETCEPLINGVPFSDANNAAKINAGLDIINTLSSHYNISAPVIIDNRESINELIPTSGQIINLVVSKDKNLVIK